MKYLTYIKLQRELVVQTLNSNKIRATTDTENILIELTKSIVQKQSELNNYLKIGEVYRLIFSF